MLRVNSHCQFALAMSFYLVVILTCQNIIGAKNCNSETLCDQTACDAIDGEIRAKKLEKPDIFSALYPKRLRTLSERLLDHGIAFEGNVTTYYQGNVAGGRQRKFQFSGHGDYVANLNLEKLGFGRGQFLKVRAEHRFGVPITQAAGALLPPNTVAEVPKRNSEDLLVTNLVFIQALSESFLVYFGKLDTLGEMDGSLVSGRGINQFSNLALVSDPIGLRTVAFSTLGTGFTVLRNGEKVFNLLALNAHDTVETLGFTELYSKGVAIIPEITLPTKFGGLRGKHTFTGIWNTKTYVELNQPPLFYFPTVPIKRQEGSWVLSYSAEQFLAAKSDNEKIGWGIFGHAAIADKQTNPIKYFFTLGLAGHNLAEGREGDRFGLGGFYYGLSDEIEPALTSMVGGIQNGAGLELFYNWKLNRSTELTFDTQYLQSPLKQYDDTLLVGMRLNLTF